MLEAVRYCVEGKYRVLGEVISIHACVKLFIFNSTSQDIPTIVLFLVLYSQ